MSSTKDTLRALWHYADSIRGKEPRVAWHALVALAQGKLGDHVLTCDVLEALRVSATWREYGQYLPPILVSRFMADLGQIMQPRSVLDMTCGTGLILHKIVAACKPDVAEGIDINIDCVEVSRSLLNNQATIKHGDLFDHATQSQLAYDLVVADPPLGIRVKPVETHPTLNGSRLREEAQLVALQGCQWLSESGALAVVVSKNAIHDAPFVSAIARYGCRIRAVLQIPEGTRIDTAVASQIVVIERGLQEGVFVAELSDDQLHSERLLQNYKRHKSDKHPSLGRVIELDRFYGYKALLADYMLRERVRKTSLSTYSFSELVVDERKIKVDDLVSSLLALPPNSILVDEVGRVSVADAIEPPSKSDSYNCYALDATKVDVSYFVSWLSSELGQLAIQAAGGNSSRSKHVLIAKRRDLMKCHIPPLEAQTQILKALQHLEAVRVEVREIEALCWTTALDGADILHRAETINRDDRYLDWLVTLPYPLASILYRHHVSGDDPRIRFTTLLHFFEALTEFLATIHLSAFIGDHQLWQKYQQPINRVFKDHQLSFDRATFGAWRVIVDQLSAVTRSMLENDDEADVVMALYHAGSRVWMRKLCSSKVASVIGQALGVRNVNAAHGGAMGAAQAQELEQKLIGLVLDLRSEWGHSWSEYELVLVDKVIYEDEQYLCDLYRVVGTNSQFERTKYRTTAPMSSGKLYLLSRGSQRGMKLLPLVRVMPSPRQAANACYFYNSSDGVSQRFVSYHFEQEAEVLETFEDTAMVLRQLVIDESDNSF